MEELNPRTLAAIRKQLARMSSEPNEEIKLIINEENWAQVMADIVGPIDTPFEGGIFRCKLELPNDFPASPPKGYFLTKIFHPNISVSGEICVNMLKKDWNPASWSIANIFNVIRCLLIEPFPESALNEEAGR
jgi:ubiquitin-conjugating enzyme E2 S